VIELLLCLAIYSGRAYSDLYARYARRRKKDATVFVMISDMINGTGTDML